MAVYTQNKQIREKVRGLLEKHPELRDNDRRLCSNLWARDLKFAFQKPLNEISAKEFLQAYANGALSHSESIRRQRQILQQNHEELRGESYKERTEVIEQIEREGYWKTKDGMQYEAFE